MTCTAPGEPFRRQIDAYVDGTLAAADGGRLEAHLALCASCRVLAGDLGAIRTAARSLPPLEPPAHVWTRVAACLRADAGREPAWRLWSWQPLASGAMALLIASGLWWTGGRLAGTRPAVSSVAASASAPADPVAAALQQYTTAIAGLEEVTAQAQTSLDPDTAGVLQANLTILDGAIVESRTALEREPESEVAQESLFEALRRKVALLQDTLALINEMRQGDEEGAARIVSGLNQ
jgi:anti-sigma factor RsiW